jgi:phage terminase large subunit-like protein
MFNPVLTCIEHAAQGGRLAGDLQRSAPYPIQLIEPRQSKEERIISVLLPLLDAGKLHVPKAATWRNDFLRECADAPFGRYTDQADALCLAVGYARFAMNRRRSDDLFDEQIERPRGGWMFSA